MVDSNFIEMNETAPWTLGGLGSAHRRSLDLERSRSAHSLSPAAQLRVGLTADVVPGGKPGPRRTKPLVIVDTAGTTLHRKGDAMANQDPCLSALSGETQPGFCLSEPTPPTLRSESLIQRCVFVPAQR